MVDADPKAKWLREVRKQRGKLGKDQEDLDKIELDPHWYWVWDGFLYLNNRRQFTRGDIAMMAQSISMEAVKAYCDLKGFGEREIDEFMRLVDALDKEWKIRYADQIEHHRKQVESRSKKGRR